MEAPYTSDRVVLQSYTVTRRPYGTFLSFTQVTQVPTLSVFIEHIYYRPYTPRCSGIYIMHSTDNNITFSHELVTEQRFRTLKSQSYEATKVTKVTKV